MLDHFSPSYPPSNPKNQNFERIKRASANVIFYTHVPRTTIIWCTCSLRQNLEKMKKTPGDIIILHLCKTNDDHMTHGSWDMERDRHIFFFHFGPFLPCSSRNNPKNQNFEEWKKYQEISFYTSVPKMTIIRCMVPETWSATDRIFLSFWAIFCPFTPLKTWKNNILKNTWRYHHFIQVYQKSWSYAILFLRYGTWWM